MPFSPSQSSGDVGRAVVTQQPRPVCDLHSVETRGFECEGQCVRDIADLYRGAELPGNDVAGEVIKDCGQVEPTPAGNLQVGEVGLPELVRSCRLVLELVCSLHNDECRAGDEVVGLEDAIS